MRIYGLVGVRESFAKRRPALTFCLVMAFSLLSVAAIAICTMDRGQSDAFTAIRAIESILEKARHGDKDSQTQLRKIAGFIDKSIESLPPEDPSAAK